MSSSLLSSPAAVSFLARVSSGFIRLTGATSRWVFRESEPVHRIFREGGNVVFAFWHNRFLIMPYIYGAHFHRDRIAVIVSRSRDGELVGRVIGRFGFRAVRGSSSRGGKAAFLEMTRALREGWDAALTPDGPRGPRYRVQDGIISLAALTGVPIVPVSCCSTRQLVVRGSWDHMRIVLPLGRIAVVFRPALRLEGGLDRSGREEAAGRLRQLLLDADREAQGACRHRKKNLLGQADLL